MTSSRPYRVLMVCMGNICRSPTAEAVLRHKARERGLDHVVDVDSAGTHAYHVGHPPDPRSREAALNRGIELTGQARRVAATDFSEFDLILAMDNANYENLLAEAPPGQGDRVKKMMAYSNLGVTDEVPDPYYGGRHGFEQVLDLLDNAVAGLLDELTPVLSGGKGEQGSGGEGEGA
ncbi:MAG: low molecular weight protein-tyrosine-phosphatase [Pseudomonadota bacterium]